MKWSTRILVSLLIILVAGLLVSNIIIKKQYDKRDKSNLYWTYTKINEQPFKYLRITGGNTSNVAFEPNPHASVRILEEWRREHDGQVESFVKNDTLFINFPPESKNLYEKFWMKKMTVVRIFSPQLLGIDCINTNLGMFKLKQKNLDVSVSGISKFEVESLIRDLDSIKIVQKDTSEIIFEMSPEFRPANEKL